MGYGLRVVKGLLRRAHVVLVDKRFDRNLGIDTYAAGVSSVGKIQRAGNFDYASSPAAALRHAIHSLSIELSRFVFVDLGSGKGRTLLIAAAENFLRVEGVEVSRDLHGAAAANIARLPLRGRAPIVLHCIAAEAYVIPQEPCLFYLYNPFGEDVLSKVLENVTASWLKNPRPIYFIYMNPENRRCFEISRSIQPVTRRWQARLLDPIMFPHPMAFYMANGSDQNAPLLALRPNRRAA
jgi:hypothetical protein